MKTIVLAALSIVTAVPAFGQDTLRLPDLQEVALRADPRMRQLELQEQRTELALRNLAVERLPQFQATGDATHQSEVAAIEVDVPGVQVPEPPETRVEAALNGSLLLYDGGALGARREAERARLVAARAELAAALYPLRMEVARSYFGALLLQERLGLTEAVMEDLEARLRLVRAQVASGAALPGDTAALRAEWLAAAQQRDQLGADRRAALAVLTDLTGQRIGDADVLALPELEDAVARVRGAGAEVVPVGLEAHPQYEVFAARRDGLDRQAALVEAQTRPKASAFGKVAYGTPGLRQFVDDYHDYWLAGLRVEWTPWTWGANRREREQLRLQQEIVDTEEAAFTARMIRQVERPLRSMERLRGALETDARIIALREQVVRQARAQLDERAITVAAYVDALTDLEAARETRARHRVELAQARADYLMTLGVELR